MLSSSFLKTFTTFKLFIPIKPNGILFVIVGGLAGYFLVNEYYGEDSQYNPYLELFAWLVGVVFLLLTGVGFLYTLICWIYSLIGKKKFQISISVGLEDGQKGEAGKVPIRVSLSKMLMPLFGYLKVWVVFEDRSLSGPIIINQYSEGLKNLLSKSGETTLILTKRGHYKVQGCVICFEDYFQFFRFSRYKKFEKSFYLYAKKLEVPELNVSPSKTEEDLEKIKTNQKVESDYHNYKDFESGDDLRRIVWKIFAKNRDLVVRIPEIINPYASNLHFAASFHQVMTNRPDSEYWVGMLDYYKDVIFNVCQQLQQSGKKVDFSLDQPFANELHVDKSDQLAYQLSSAVWQKNNPPQEFLGATTILCVSSLVSVIDLDKIVQRQASILLVIRVSKYLDAINLFDWKNLFLRNGSKSEQSKMKWMLSKQRRKIKRHEKKICKLLNTEGFQSQII